MSGRLNARTDFAFAPYLPMVAYFIMGDSTAKWFYDAYRVQSDKVLLGYLQYARMIGYRHVALDYEDPEVDIPLDLVRKISRIGGFDPAPRPDERDRISRPGLRP